jgi:CRP-like cAMP-binding protein
MRIGLSTPRTLAISLLVSLVSLLLFCFPLLLEGLARLLSRRLLG